MTKQKRKYKPSEEWDDVVTTTTFQFEQLCNYMSWVGYPTYNKHFTFISDNKNCSQRYVRLDRAIKIFNSFPASFNVIEKVRLEKHKDGNGGYFLSAFNKVKFRKGFEHLVEIVLKN